MNMYQFPNIKLQLRYLKRKKRSTKNLDKVFNRHVPIKKRYNRRIEKNVLQFLNE